MRREHRGLMRPANVGEQAVLLSYEGLDRRLRQSQLFFDPVPTQLGATAAAYNLTLQPGERCALFVAAECDVDPQQRPAPFRRGMHATFRAIKTSTQGMAAVETSNVMFNRDDVPLGGRSRHADDAIRRRALIPMPASLGTRQLSAATASSRRCRCCGAIRAMARGVLRALPRYQAKTDRSARRRPAGKNPARDARRRNGGAARGAVRPLLRQRRFDAAVCLACRALCANAPATSTPCASCGRTSRRRWAGSMARAIPMATALSNITRMTEAGPRQPGLEGFTGRDLPCRRPTGRRADRAVPKCRAMSTPPNAPRAQLRARARACAARGALEQQAEHLRRAFRGQHSGARRSALTRSRSTARNALARCAASNAGHVLFSGIAAPDRARRVAAGADAAALLYRLGHPHGRAEAKPATIRCRITMDRSGRTTMR